MRAVETVHKKLQYESARKYGMHLGHRSDIVQVHRIYVPGVQDDAVSVVGIWVGGENILRRSVTLLYLNRVEQWLDWATLWGVQIELAREQDLTVEVTRKVDRPYHEYQFDRAWWAWLKQHPGQNIEAFLLWARDHVNHGRVGCEINQCEEAAVIGTTCCPAHQNYR